MSVSGLFNIEDRFIVQGVQFGCTPGSFEPVQQSMYQVRSRTTPMLYGRNLTVVQRPEDVGGNDINSRQIYHQAWEATWDADSFMYADMKDFLMNLQTTNTSFWLQYDDHMSRVGGYLIPVDTTYLTYATPTYPIEPFANTPTTPQSYSNHIYVDGVPISAGYTVDNERGIVLFGTPYTSSNVLTMDYTWKCYCRISECVLEPVDYPQGIYVGKVLFQQMPPNNSDTAWSIQIPLNR
ncbi:MAG TPA: hypothetical protein VKR58_05985 [Aquella sp.]|nr:hypothetical protein [Aquella sp.]